MAGGARWLGGRTCHPRAGEEVAGEAGGRWLRGDQGLQALTAAQRLQGALLLADDALQAGDEAERIPLPLPGRPLERAQLLAPPALCPPQPRPVCARLLLQPLQVPVVLQEGEQVRQHR